MHDVDVMPRSGMHVHVPRCVMRMLRRLAVDFFLIVAAMAAYLGLYLALRMVLVLVMALVMVLVRTMVISAAVVVIMTALAGQRRAGGGQYRNRQAQMTQ